VCTVHHIVSTVIEIPVSVCHAGGPAQHEHRSLEFHHLLLNNLITGLSGYYLTLDNE